MILPHSPYKATPHSEVWKENPHAQGGGYFRDMVEYMDTLVALELSSYPLSPR